MEGIAKGHKEILGLVDNFTISIVVMVPPGQTCENLSSCILQICVV